MRLLHRLLDLFLWRDLPWNRNAVLGLLHLGLRLCLRHAFALIGDNILALLRMRNRDRSSNRLARTYAMVSNQQSAISTQQSVACFSPDLWSIRVPPR
jgi:hypothetical protein